MKKQTASVVSAFLLILLTYNSLYSQNGWQVLNSSYNSHLTSISVIDSFLVYATGKDLLKTTNGGLNWIKINIDTNYTYLEVSFSNKDTGFVLARKTSNYNYFLLRTLNGGDDWSSIQFVTGNYLFLNLQAKKNILFIISQYSGSPFPSAKLSKSTNFGLNWIDVYHAVGLGIYGYFKNDLTGFLVPTSHNQIRTSTNGGFSWTISNIINEYSASFYGLNSNSSSAYCFLTNYLTGHTKLIKTSNYGISWDSINSNIYSGIGFFTSNDTGYCYSINRIYKTTNGAANWTQNFFAGNVINKIEFLNSKTGYAVGNDGLIIKTTTGGETVGIQSISNDIPNEFSLLQNYPNPFNPQTKIKFEIPKNDFVRVVIYDNLGKEVKTIVNEQLNVGTYEADFNGEELSSGIYYYRLVTSGFSETKKMLLLK